MKKLFSHRQAVHRSWQSQFNVVCIHFQGPTPPRNFAAQTLWFGLLRVVQFEICQMIAGCLISLVTGEPDGARPFFRWVDDKCCSCCGKRRPVADMDDLAYERHREESPSPNPPPKIITVPVTLAPVSGKAQDSSAEEASATAK